MFALPCLWSWRLTLIELGEAHLCELSLKRPLWAWCWVILHSGLLKSPSKELLFIFFLCYPICFNQLASNRSELNPWQQCLIEHDSDVTKLERGLGCMVQMRLWSCISSFPGWERNLFLLKPNLPSGLQCWECVHIWLKLMSSTARTDALLISPFSPPEFSCSFRFFFQVVCQVLQRTTEEALEQTTMYLEQLDLIWCDSFPLSPSTVLPAKTGLAGGREWSLAIALGICWAGSLARVAPSLAETLAMTWRAQLQPCAGKASTWIFFGGHFVSILNLSPGYSHQRPRCTCASRNRIKSLPARSNHPIFCAFSFRILWPLCHTAAD